MLPAELSWCGQPGSTTRTPGFGDVKLGCQSRGHSSESQIEEEVLAYGQAHRHWLVGEGGTEKTDFFFKAELNQSKARLNSGRTLFP